LLGDCQEFEILKNKEKFLLMQESGEMETLRPVNRIGDKKKIELHGIDGCYKGWARNMSMKHSVKEMP